MSLRSSFSLLRVVLPLLALVVTSRAAAQSITLNVAGESSVSIGKDDCDFPLTVRWTATTGASTPCSDLTIWVTSSSSCGNEPGTSDQTLATIPLSTWSSTGSGDVTLPVTGLPALAGGTCPKLDVEQDHKVCARTTYNSFGICNTQTNADLKPATPPTVRYDTKAPAVPTITSVVPMDGALQIRFSAEQNAALVYAYYRSDPLANYTPGPSATGPSGSVRVNNLTNGTVYEVALRAEDAAGNQSDYSASSAGTPVASYGFFAAYQNAGGDETGGCAAAPAGAFPLLALGWVLARRRRRSLPRGLAAVALLALAPAAWAQEAITSGAVVGGRAPGEVGTERTMGMEVKLGAFKPLIDREPGLTGAPYAETYGDNPMLLLEVSGERQLFQALGTAAVGFTAGYAEKYAPARLDTGGVASESTGLRLVPLRLYAAYRFDYAAHLWGIPLVPYAKLGLNYTIWSVTKGSDLEVTAAGGRALGGRFGWGFTGGLSLLLDVFEPRMARDFDTDLGVNHSYLFAEYNYADVNNFGAGGLDLSGRYLMFGAAFEF